ncbi:MAG: transposase [archaeon]|nr:transposase [archaeon]
MAPTIPEEIITLDPEGIDFDDKEAVKSLILKLLNIIESQAQLIHELQNENQSLKDEINRLKGEKGKPKFSSKTSEKEADVPNPKGEGKKNWRKSAKKSRVKIDRTEYRRVDRKILPPDSEHKGYRSVVVQNIKFTTDNVEYKLERFYSPSENKLYEAELPEDIHGEFEDDLKAFVVYLYYACRVTENKIKKILEEAGIIISAGEISNILTQEKKEELTKEREEILKVGLESSIYFHTDDTGLKHEGKNHHVHVICNQMFSAFFITPKKDRDTIRSFLGLKKDEKTDKIMISDDARQYPGIAVYHALCWIHQIRLYKKLNPLIDYHRIQLQEFLTRVWAFYDLLDRFRENPGDEEKEKLENEFDELFSTETGYEELDKRIALTKEKKEELLLVLRFPEIPLHNNPAELALREPVVKRKISNGTRSEDGKTAWEKMMSILDTCKKQGVGFFDYIRDIFSGKRAMTRLAHLISRNASQKPTFY